MIETVKEILFENPLMLGIVVFFGLMILTGYWNVTRSPTSRRVLLTGLVLAPLLFLLQALVETRREKLIQTIRQMAGYVESGDVKGVVSLIDARASFDDQHTRDDFQTHLEHLLDKYDVRNPTVSIVDMTFDHNQAVVNCGSRATVSTSQWSYSVPSKWELKFTFSSDNWLVTDITPITIANQRYGSFWGIH